MGGLAFQRTLRSLETDAAWPARLGVALAALGISAGTLWLFCARVSVYAVSELARVEMTRAAPVEAKVSGAVTAVHLVLGRPVHEGEVLVELDSEAFRIQLEEKRALAENLTAQIAVLGKEIRGDEGRVRQRQHLLEQKVAEAKAHAHEASALSRYAQRTVRRTSALLQEHLVSQADHDRDEADAQARQAAVDQSVRAQQRVAVEGRVAESDVRQEMLELEREEEALRGQKLSTEAQMRELAKQIDLCLIRAPAAGHLGEIARLQIGAVVQVGDRVATVVPDDRLDVVAEYQPVDAVGRIQPGQLATLRLTGFPGIRYGTLRATVEHVANETRDGRVRVDLTVARDGLAAVQLRHGMPASVDIEIERVAPAALLRRSVVGMLQ